jgi:hypothetical protein
VTEQRELIALGELARRISEEIEIYFETSLTGKLGAIIEFYPHRPQRGVRCVVDGEEVVLSTEIRVYEVKE